MTTSDFKVGDKVFAIKDDARGSLYAYVGDGELVVTDSYHLLTVQDKLGHSWSANAKTIFKKEDVNKVNNDFKIGDKVYAKKDASGHGLKRFVGTDELTIDSIDYIKNGNFICRDSLGQGWSARPDEIHKEEVVDEVIASSSAGIILGDDPEWDGTDFAHPAWLRGNEQGCQSACREFESWIDEPFQHGNYGGECFNKALAKVNGMLAEFDRLAAQNLVLQEEMRRLEQDYIAACRTLVKLENQVYGER